MEGDGITRGGRGMKMKKIIPTLLRMGLGALFVYASYHKILSPDAFADAINNYHILPIFLVNIAALTLPYVELLFGLFLIFNFRPLPASLATLLLILVFFAATLSAYLRGIDTGCGCFSAQGEPINWLTLGRDLIFLVWAFLVVRHAFSQKSPNQEQPEGI